MSSEIPSGAIPGPILYSKEPACQKCTHYLSEHIEGTACKHLMYSLPLDEAQKEFVEAGFDVVAARQLCDCQEFVK